MDLSKFSSLLCVLCSVILWGLLTVIIEQQAMGQLVVRLTIETPEVDRKEGGQVEMMCYVQSQQGGINMLIPKWTTGNPSRVVESGDRFTLTRTANTDWTLVEYYLNISDLQRDDSGEYACSVGENTSKVNLSVLYFPNESFPICSPDGSITVNIGMQLNMRCSSEGGNSAVDMEVLRGSMSNITKFHIWKESKRNDTITNSLNLTLEADDHGALFLCFISSTFFPDMNNACTIGPINVTDNSDLETDPPSTEPNAALIPGASAGGAIALVSIILILIVICQRRHLCKIKQEPEMPNNNTDIDLTTVHPELFESKTCKNSEQNKSANSQRDIHQDQLPAKETANRPHESSDTIRPDEDNAQPPVSPNETIGSSIIIGNTGQMEYLDNSHGDVTNEEDSSNPVTVVQNVDDASGSSGGTGAPIKPVAKVSPMQQVPPKPAPYKPKANSIRTSIIHASFSNQYDQTSLMAPSTPLQTPELIPQNTPPHESNRDEGQETDLPRPEDEPDEVQVPPIPEHDEKPPPDPIVYADLDLQENPSDDGDHQPISAEEAAVYATVTIPPQN